MVLEFENIYSFCLGDIFAMCKIIRRNRKSFFGFRFGGVKYEAPKRAEMYVQCNLQIESEIFFAINKYTCDRILEFEVITKIYKLSRRCSYVRVVDDKRTK